MRMFARAGAQPLPSIAGETLNSETLWPTDGTKKTEVQETVTETVTEKETKAGSKKPTYEKKPLKKTEKKPK